MDTHLFESLVDKTLTKRKLFDMVEKDFGLLPSMVDGMHSSKAAIRYGCGSVLMKLSEKHPAKLYPFFDVFTGLLESKYRILTWQAMAIVANLCSVDSEKKFDEIFDRYFQFIHDEYMVTVANVVGNASKIVLAKPYLAIKITHELLKVESLKITPHLTDECRRVIAEKTIGSFDVFFHLVVEKDVVFAFVKKYRTSSRKSLQECALAFLKKW